jgi:hypothetical protein
MLKNPEIGLGQKNSFDLGFARFDNKDSHGGVTKRANRRPMLQAGSLDEIRQCASLASIIVIEAKIRVFQHNPRIAVVHCVIVLFAENTTQRSFGPRHADGGGPRD